MMMQTEKWSGTLNVKIIPVLVTLASILWTGAVSATQPSNAELVDDACPTQWKNLDIIIDPTISNHWQSNASDEADFVGFLRQYLFSTTLDTSNFEANADDAITVASECLLRKNMALDAYFNKTIDTTTKLASRAGILTVLFNYILNE